MPGVLAIHINTYVHVYKDPTYECKHFRKKVNGSRLLPCRMNTKGVTKQIQ